MKILLSSEWYCPIINGVVTSIVNLRSELIKRGHDVRVLTISRTKDSYVKDGVYYLGSQSFEKIYPNARQAFFSGREISEALIDWNPDVIHTQTEFSCFRYSRKIARRTDAVMVHTYHTVYEDYTHYFAFNRQLGKFAVKYFTKNILGKVDAVIVPTKKVERLLDRYGVACQVRVVPTGLDLSKFDRELSREDRKKLRMKYGISEEEFIAVYVGRVAEEKNLEELLTYFSSQKAVRLLLVGDGPYLHSLKEQVHRMNLEERVLFTGMVPPSEVASYYQTGDVFVCASNSETQGLTYIEAMASGLPVLVKADECLESVVEEGENGWMYHGEADFDEKLQLLLHDINMRKDMSVCAKSHAMKKFSSEVFAKKVESVYCSALADRKK